MLLDDVQLFPRFHEMVKSSLKKSEPKLENIEIEISEKTKKLQRILLDLLQKSVVEIRKSGVEMGKYSVESLITWYGLENWVNEHVEPVWDILS